MSPKNWMTLRPKHLGKLNLTPEEIIYILNKYGVTEEIVMRINKAYKDKLNSSILFRRINDIINYLDITDQDENNIKNSIDSVVERNFVAFVSEGKLTYNEIIFFIKSNLVSDEEIIKSFKIYHAQEFADIILRWRPHLFEKDLQDYKRQFKITISKIEKSKSFSVSLEKFRAIINSIF